MAPDAARVLERCDALGAISEEAGRLTRRFATPALTEAVDLVAGWMTAAGLDVRRDPVGGLVGRYAGTGGRALLVGSHLDSVRDAGRYDGPLGVLVALALVERLAAAGRRLPFAVDVCAFADEEGTRYGTAYLGSSILAGSFEPAWLERRDDDGVAMADAIRAVGGDPGAIAAGARAPGSLVAYLEAHIEQGPVLEDRGLPVGVVAAIQGASRATVAFRGVAGHAGTVPMDGRSDALCAAAEWTLAVEAEGRRRAGLVATVGRLRVEPDASNVIPGGAFATLDLRHADDATRAEALAAVHEAATAIAARRDVELGWEPALEEPAVACDPALRALLGQAIAAEGLPVLELASGGGHDAVALSAICPVAMLFVRCAGGVSHNPAESVTEEDVAVAIDVLERVVTALPG